MSDENENSNTGSRDEGKQPNHKASAVRRADRSLRRKRPVRPLDELSRKSIVDMHDVVRFTTLSRATIYRMMAAGTFPSNKEIGTRRRGWRFGTIEDWMENSR